MYCAEREDGYGDFASIAIKDEHLEFRFDTGSGELLHARHSGADRSKSA
jgi:hypothetical protein